MNVLSLFNGFGGAFLALEKANVRVEKIYVSEVDKHAIKCADAINPNNINLGDVCNIDVSKLDKIDMIVGGSPCFVAGTKILTIDGYKNIENISISDMVLTHKNNWRTVRNIGGQEKETLLIKSTGFYDIVTTNNHPFYVREMNRVWDNSIRSSKRVFSEPKWKNAGDLKKDDFVAMPINKDSVNFHDLTIEECFILGRYIADGHTRKDYRKSEGRPNDRQWQLILSIGNKKNFQTSLNYSLFQHTKNVERMIFSNKRLVQIAEKECGCGAINKRISNHLLMLPKEHLKSLLDGIESGDGHVKGDKIVLNSISKELIQSMQLAVAKVYNLGATCGYFKRPKTTVIEGRTVNQHDTYIISYSKKPRKQNNFIADENHIWYRFKESIPGERQKVYNLEVFEDNSYTAENCVVHNCQSFSFAGKRKGMSTTDNIKITTLEQYIELKENNFEFEGQSFLFWEYMRILKDIQKYNPDVIFFLENVVMTKDWEYILSEAIGIKSVMINSSLVSAQNRKRLYWSNIKTTTEGFFSEVVQDIEQPEDLGILLKDVLEDEVDEKYYLSDEKIAGFEGLDINKKGRTLRVGGGCSADDKHNYDLIKIDVSGKPKASQQKASCLTVGGHSGGNHSDMDLIVTGVDYRTDEGFRERKNGKTGTLAARAREDESCGQLAKINTRIRRLTPRECFRLQTVAENHIDTLLNCGVSNSQLYRCCGNGWTIDVIAHFFKELRGALNEN